MPRHVLISLSLLSGSLLAQTTWTSFADRRGHAMARTSTGGVVMFGGESVSSPGELLGDTVELSTNNQTWTGAGGGAEPPPTSGHAMAGTVVSGQQAYVLFGGVTSTGQTGRTYKYNGNAWGDVTSGVSPLARSAHAMVTNTATNTMLMFGGFDGTLALNDVWEFAPGTDTWTPQTVGAAPIGRFGACLAFHPGSGGSNGRMYMFGGSPFRNDLWEFNPTTSTWTQLFPAVSPPGRRHAAMAYLAGSDTIVMFGGLSSGGVIRNDTWSYDRSSNTWTQESPTSVPPARYEHAVSADNTGNNLVLLGGINVLPGSGAGPVLDETWLWSSLVSNWVRQIPAPSPRDEGAMAYDSVRNRHVVFGGRTTPGGVALNETWELEGLNWRPRSPSSPPSARTEAGMVFDAARNVTVLHGGRSPGGVDLADTWEWNGISWTQKPSGSAPAASGHQLAFDAARGVATVGMGFRDLYPVDQLVMWRWNGTAWSADSLSPSSPAVWNSTLGKLVTWNTLTWALSPSWTMAAVTTAQPPARSGIAVVYDGARQEMVVFGGCTDLATSMLNDTWTWNGSTWTQKAPSTSPPARVAEGCLSYDPIRQRVVLFGGFTDWNSRVALTDTWEWDGANWVQKFPAVAAAARWGAACAYDPARARVVMVGGSNGFSPVNDTIEYDGSVWTSFPQAGPGPCPFTLGSAAYDAVNSRLVVFSGYGGSGASTQQTWHRTGTSWVDVTPANNSLGQTVGASLVFDGANVYSFGGAYWTTGFVETRNQVHRWDGQAIGWTLVDATAPSARRHYGAAYDARRSCIVMFGGESLGGTVRNNETWEWNGQGWRQRSPANPPSARSRCKLAFDESRGRIVLYGGTDGMATFDDTWEYWVDSLGVAQWAQRTPVANPPAGSSGHGFAYDASRKVTVAHWSIGTWDYGPTNPATLTLYGSGCPTSGSVPASAPFGLKPLPWTGAWLGEPVEMEFTNAPPGLGLFLFGLSYTQFGAIPLPLSLALVGLGPAACMLRNSADVIDVMPVAVTRYVSFPMPSSPSALGLPLYGQAAFFDLGQPGFPVVTSDGAEMVIGQK